MKALGPDARALIEAARGAGEPDRAARARVRSAVVRRAGTVAAAGAGLSATLKAAASGAGALAAKGFFAIAIAIVGASAVAGGAYALRAREASAPIARQNEPSTPKPRRLEASTAERQAPSSPPLSVSVPHSISGDGRSEALPRPPLVPKKKQPQLDPPTSLAPDIARLREARAALNGGDASHALELLDRVADGGPLAEEREGLRAIAQCMLDRQGARAAGERFLETWPTSPLRARVVAMCAIR